MSVVDLREYRNKKNVHQEIKTYNAIEQDYINYETILELFSILPKHFIVRAIQYCLKNQIVSFDDLGLKQHDDPTP